MFSFSSINITYLLPQLHAFQGTVGAQSRSVLLGTLCFAVSAPGLVLTLQSSVCHPQHSAAPPHPVARALLCILNPPVPCQSLPMPAQPDCSRPSSSSPAASPHPLREEGKRGGSGRAEAQVDQPSEPALCRTMGRGKVFFGSWPLGVTSIT